MEGGGEDDMKGQRRAGRMVRVFREDGQGGL
jgi:hypothetical protein